MPLLIRFTLEVVQALLPAWIGSRPARSGLEAKRRELRGETVTDLAIDNAVRSMAAR